MLKSDGVLYNMLWWYIIPSVISSYVFFCDFNEISLFIFTEYDFDINNEKKKWDSIVVSRF